MKIHENMVYLEAIKCQFNMVKFDDMSWFREVVFGATWNITVGQVQKMAPECHNLGKK